MGSVDYSGYHREECLRGLIEDFAPGDENRILLRLTDWVPEVQGLARQWVVQHFASLPIEAIIANQRLLLYLTRKELLKDDIGLEVIKSNLLERARIMTADGFQALLPMFRRFLYTVSMEGDQYLRRWILDDPDPFNRLLLLRLLPYDQLHDEEVKRLSEDTSLYVRRRMFYQRVAAGVRPVIEELRDMALDSRRGIRELGQYYLNALYQVDAYKLYLGVKGESFYFIADYGRKDDAEHFLEGVRKGGRDTRYNCLKALVAAGHERIAELDVRRLIEGNRRLRAVMLSALPRVLSVEDILALRPSFETSSPGGLISFLTLLEKKSFWAFVEEGLGVLLSQPASPVAEYVERAIRRKVEVYELLQPARRAVIEAWINELKKSGMVIETLRLIEFTMGKPASSR